MGGKHGHSVRYQSPIKEIEILISQVGQVFKTSPIRIFEDLETRGKGVGRDDFIECCMYRFCESHFNQRLACSPNLKRVRILIMCIVKVLCQQLFLENVT